MYEFSGVHSELLSAPKQVVCSFTLVVLGVLLLAMQFGTIASDELDERDRVETLKLTIEALKTQLEDKTRLSNEKITTLMEDRRIREEESRTVRRARLATVSRLNICQT